MKQYCEIFLTAVGLAVLLSLSILQFISANENESVFESSAGLPVVFGDYADSRLCRSTSANLNQQLPELAELNLDSEAEDCLDDAGSALLLEDWAGEGRFVWYSNDALTFERY